MPTFTMLVISIIDAYRPERVLSLSSSHINWLLTADPLTGNLDDAPSALIVDCYRQGLITISRKVWTWRLSRLGRELLDRVSHDEAYLGSPACDALSLDRFMIFDETCGSIGSESLN